MVKLVTITTDFGNVDGFVGIMKGVMLGIAPQLHFVDVSNELAAGDIASGAWVLGNSYQFFPSGSIHLVVVDPGVGSARRGIIVRSREHTFVAPDNGVLHYVLQDFNAVDCYYLNESRFWRASVSSTFHGRDIFAPVAAHLAAGIEPSAMGSEIKFSSLVRLPELPMEITRDTIRGAVAYVDRFGNLISNIPMSALETSRFCIVASTKVPVGKTYSSVEGGSAVALGGSHGFIEIGVNGGRADTKFGAKIGTEFIVNFDNHGSLSVPASNLSDFSP